MTRINPSAPAPPPDKIMGMSSQSPQLNRVGMPPPGRTIHRRRAQLEEEAIAAGEGPADSRRQLILSIIACGGVLVLGLLVAWLVL